VGPDWESGSVTSKARLIQKERSEEIFKCGMFSSGAGGFSFSKQALYVGLRINTELSIFSKQF
jgi:hypothetical protein